VTESLTLIAGIPRVPFFNLWTKFLTPVVVSSETPKKNKKKETIYL
jgi:hypothetical protein